MDAKRACDALAALGQSTRLDIVDLLAASEAALSAGDIARQLNVTPSTLSTHLAILNRAGLIAVSKNGRSMFYTSEKTTLEQLATYIARKAA